MEKVKIGFNAGKLYKFIEENREVKLTVLKKTTKMDIKDMYLALGWLARENKIHFFDLEGDMAVSIIY